jgi:quercetin dioxygenase-like cupin family protein
MRKIRISEVEVVPIDTATPIPGWTGGAVRRTRQNLLPDGASKNFSSSVVNFELGATTGWHKHTSDQILVITAGAGIVANENEEHEVVVGDVVHILEGEHHWHGAKKESSMSHITITAV